LDKLLRETDAPYLAPVPFRGKINKPAYVKYIAEYIINLRNIDIEEFALQLRQNYYRVFGQGNT
jgi:TatD DNase family protein